MSDETLYIFATDAFLTPAGIDPRMLRLMHILQAKPTNRFALATSAPKVGLRIKLRLTEGATKSDYDLLPLPGPTVRRHEKIGRVLLPKRDRMQVYVSFAYYDNTTEEWGPNPPNLLAGKADRWDHNWILPNPGMLIRAMQDTGITQERTTLIGPSFPYDTGNFDTSKAYWAWKIAAGAENVTHEQIDLFYRTHGLEANSQ